jgi:hypothetical protein
LKNKSEEIKKEGRKISFFAPLFLGSKFKVSSLRFQVPGSRFQVPGSRFRVPG